MKTSTDTELKFKRDFLLVNFNNTIELRTKNTEYLNNIKYWFIIVWNSGLGLSINQKIDHFKTQLLLATITTTFFLLHLVVLAFRVSLQDAIEKFEYYIVNSTDKAITQLNGPLNSLLDKASRRKNMYRYVRVAIFDPIHSILYYIIFVFSFLVPVMLDAV